MGIDLCLIWNNERVAELGRANYYEKTDTEELKHRVVRNILAHLCYQPKDHEELLTIAEEIADAIETLCEHKLREGHAQLLNDLREQGFETLTDIEWGERETLKNKPDYINPKFK